VVTKYQRVAHIARARGLAGEVVAIPAMNLPFDLWDGLQVWVVPPDHGLVRQTRVRAATLQKSALVLSLEGCDDLGCAKRLIGRSLLALDEACGAYQQARDPGLLGFKVHDKNSGFLGTISSINKGVAQTLWTLEGPYGSILVPAVDEFIEFQDETGVYMDLPKGLVELNR